MLSVGIPLEKIDGLEVSEFIDWLQAAKAFRKNDQLIQRNNLLFARSTTKKGADELTKMNRQLLIERDKLLMQKINIPGVAMPRDFN